MISRTDPVIPVVVEVRVVEVVVPSVVGVTTVLRTRPVVVGLNLSPVFLSTNRPFPRGTPVGDPCQNNDRSLSQALASGTLASVFNIIYFFVVLTRVVFHATRL